MIADVDVLGAKLLPRLRRRSSRCVGAGGEGAGGEGRVSGCCEMVVVRRVAVALSSIADGSGGRAAGGAGDVDGEGFRLSRERL